MSSDATGAQDRAFTQQKMLNFFCDHLVSLGGTFVFLDPQGRDRGLERFFALSGFILDVRDTWCLVTAGHAINDLEDLCKTGECRLTNCCLAAHFGSNPAAERPIPFDYGDSGRMSINDEEEGLDFALLTLTDEQRAVLTANGIRPIAQHNWEQQRIEKCEIFAMLGLPRCLVAERECLVPYGDGVAGIVNPVLAPVFRTELATDEMPPSTYPWFVGTVGAADQLPDLDGMSGGPIFGFFKGEDDQWRYWIVAVQSRWNKERRIVFACPVPVIGRLVEEYLEEYGRTQQP